MSKAENKVSMVTLGCAKNLVDTEVLVGGLKNNQYDINEIHRDINEIQCGIEEHQCDNNENQ